VENTKTCCWTISPNVGAGKISASMILDFADFNFNQSTLTLYSSIGQNSQDRIAQYSGQLGDPEAPQPGTQGFKHGVISLWRDGNGPASFTLAYRAGKDSQLGTSLRVFYSIIFMFLFPLTFPVVMSCPFIKLESQKRKDQITTILFVIGSLIGGLFMILILAGVMTF